MPELLAGQIFFFKAWDCQLLGNKQNHLAHDIRSVQNQDSHGEQMSKHLWLDHLFSRALTVTWHWQMTPHHCHGAWASDCGTTKPSGLSDHHVTEICTAWAGMWHCRLGMVSNVITFLGKWMPSKMQTSLKGSHPVWCLYNGKSAAPPSLLRPGHAPH